MRFLKTLYHIWKGDLFTEEIKKNLDMLHEVRVAIRDTQRAQLNGEDHWLRPERKVDGE